MTVWTVTIVIGTKNAWPWINILQTFDFWKRCWTNDEVMNHANCFYFLQRNTLFSRTHLWFLTTWQRQKPSDGGTKPIAHKQWRPMRNGSKQHVNWKNRLASGSNWSDLKKLESLFELWSCQVKMLLPKVTDDEMQIKSVVIEIPLW